MSAISAEIEQRVKNDYRIVVCNLILNARESILRIEKEKNDDL